MPVVFLSALPMQWTMFTTSGGGNVPASGGKLFTYVAGSVNTKTNVYTDNTGTVAYSNPIVLDSNGRIPNGGIIWQPQGVTVKYVLAPLNDSDPPTSPYWTEDNIPGTNDSTSVEWVAGPTPTFVNSSSFTMAGDQTGAFNVARRLKFSVTAGTVYGSVGKSAFATSTTVNPIFSSGSLDAGLTAVWYSLISVDPSSINADYIHKKATAVPSAGNGTTNIWGVSGDYAHVTGTNTIASFSTAPYAGAERTVIFDGALTLIHGANLLVPGAANVSTAANDCAKVRADATTTAIVTFYQPASVSPLAGFTTGDAKLTIKTVADAGWIVMDDGTIGSATSGASTRANSDCQNLFTLLWNNVIDTWAPVVTGRGASAAADWAANKKITLTRQLGRSIIIAGAGSGLTSRALGNFLGEETHAPTLAEMFAHAHTIVGSVSTGGASQTVNGATGAANNQATSSDGSSTPFNVMQPSSAWNIHLKL